MSISTDNVLFDYIIENAPNAKYHPTTQWMECRCPYCTEENSPKRKFNIQLKEGKPLVYTCFRASCGVKGVLSKKVARDLGLVDPKFLKIINKQFNENIVIDSSARNIIKGFNNIDLGELSEDGKGYFKYRTGKELTKDLQSKFRITTSISTFLHDNDNISRMNYDAMRVLAYNENIRGEKYIYFFNERYTMVYGRQINGDKKIKMSIVSTDSLSKHVPYTFRGEGEKRYKDTKAEDTLFIGEGVFDIINAYFYLYKQMKGVFMASTSFKATQQCISLFSKYRYKPDIVILSDDDIPINVYKYSLLRRLDLKRLSDIYVVYNLEGKDLGDYKNKSFKIDTTKLHVGG